VKEENHLWHYRWRIPYDISTPNAKDEVTNAWSW